MMNVTTMQHHRCYADILMDIFAMVNVVTMQRHIFNANTSMDISTMMNVTTTQLGTSCSFDSPGLARNEPTPGQRSQGDSTPSVLSFFCEGTLIMNPFMSDYVEKAQHLRRCSPHTIPQPRVAYTIVWQPWAIKNATPTALVRMFHGVINVYTHMD